MQRWRRTGDPLVVHRPPPPPRNGGPAPPTVLVPKPAAQRPECAIEGCTQPVKTRQWCGRHYNRWLATGDPCTPYQRVPAVPPITSRLSVQSVDGT
jgi:hypothetical protein